MPAPMKFIFAGLCLLLLSATNIKAEEHQTPLQCWHCSSNTIGAEDFCDVTFQEDNIPVDLLKERNINLLRACNNTINSDHERPVCRKTVEEHNGKTITRRFCYYTHKSDRVEYCNMTAPDDNVQRLFCEDCVTDRCNGVASLTAILSAILLPTLANQLAI